LEDAIARLLLGIEQLAKIERKPFTWPKAAMNDLCDAA
jgi:hypothetical protein